MSEEKEKDLYPENFGRPPHFKTPEELEEMAKSYFENDAMVTVETIVEENGEEKKVKQFRPTITGLALHLGFCSRQSFYDYEKRKDFSYSVKKARTFVEWYYETKLAGQFVTGPVFALKQFGWSDKQEIDHKNNGKSFDRPKIIFTKTEGKTHDDKQPDE